MGVTIDFNIPTYLRVEHGLAVVSQRLDHLLPEQERVSQVEVEKPNPVVINRIFNPKRLDNAPKPEYQEKEIVDHFENEAPLSNNLLDSPEEVDSVDQVDEELTELSIRGNQGKPVEGVYLGSGFAPYRFNKGNSKSFYLRIDSHLIWGVELNSAIKRSEARKGDRIAVTFLGKVPIKVLQKVNVDGKPSEVWETRHRNRWEIKVLPD